MDAIATAEGIEVTPDDMNREIFIMAQNFGADPKEVWDIIAKEGRVAMLAGSVARKKQLDSLLIMQKALKRLNNSLLN